mmetsp:Transcript_16796/g.31826  ORF Transcript_16796/g.31826 Transcript_16796/m.31826 type:complete len:225 (+) Transcript_16796:155-829(+)
MDPKKQSCPAAKLIKPQRYFAFVVLNSFVNNHSPANIGKCPRCSQYIQVKNGVVCKSTAPLIECSICKQKRLAHTNNNNNNGQLLRQKICVACFFGINNRLRYECEGCHRFQMIPHPMYRYQEYPTSFSTSTWACHVGCHDYTRWRIIASDVRKVPVDDAPDGWSLREQEFETIRGIRRAEIQVGFVGEDGVRGETSIRSRLYSTFSRFFSTTDNGDGSNAGEE